MSMTIHELMQTDAYLGCEFYMVDKDGNWFDVNGNLIDPNKLEFTIDIKDEKTNL